MQCSLRPSSHGRIFKIVIFPNRETTLETSLVCFYAFVDIPIIRASFRFSTGENLDQNWLNPAQGSLECFEDD